MMLKLLRRIFSKLNYLFFVGSTDILPEPFNKEEEEKYVNMFLNGDMTARDKLIEHNLRLVVFLAKKYENTKIDLEDLVSYLNELIFIRMIRILNLLIMLIDV